MTRYFCHECQHEGSDFLETPEPLCPHCQGSFVEELPADDSDPSPDDPRDFDPADGPGIPLGELLQEIGRGGASGVQPFGQAHGGGFAFAIGPDGNIIAARGAQGRGGGAASGPGAPPNLGSTILSALGLAAPLGGTAQQRSQNTEAVEDPDDEELPREDHEPRNQVPIQNLAAFLGEAFGDPEPHPADDPSNNPFAEGGVDQTTSERRSNSDPGPNGVRDASADRPTRRDGNPLSYLFSLMNAFGINSGLAGNAGDYVWGGEANFQNLLNDLMEQAAGRAGPVPATEEMIEKLPKVEVTPDLLSHDTVKDCTICQDDFVVSETLASLPCRHLFHPDCIVPWLKTSGTCPVCRYALIPQPGQEGYIEPEPPRSDHTAQSAPFGTTSDTTSPQASTSADLSRNAPAPVLSRSGSSNVVPSTARIPEVQNGSRLPGSWTFGGNIGHGDPMDIDEAGDGAHDAWTDAEDEQEDKSPERRAAEAAEQRLARERHSQQQSSRMNHDADQPVIEDVD
ncbi:uncharacterized protein JCM15063_005959 [Sporobolomyces koalae]|uniref:uncharacterized protein n=1 Tax=Sporobolomyces koalae TaxID=500713 RepID=UPI00316ECF2A